MLLALVGHVQAIGLLQGSLQRGRGRGEKDRNTRDAGRVRQMQREGWREHKIDRGGGARRQSGVTEVVSLGTQALPASGLWQVRSPGRRGSWTLKVWMPLWPPPGLSEQPPLKLMKAQDTGRTVMHRHYPDEESEAQSREDPSPCLLTRHTQHSFPGDLSLPCFGLGVNELLAL